MIADTKELRELKKIFSQKLRAAIKEKGWKPSELAQRSGLNRDCISRYMNEKSLPTDTNLSKVADALGKAPNELIPSAAVVIAQVEDKDVDLMVREVGNNKWYLKVGKTLTKEQAMRIMTILSDDAEK